ncbi:MAG: N-acetylmuramoyl-L-alanine amidase, partial [Gammaproteobacteria bacterium]|nr:N-acetylmuramoyl-L-alanine amidase [Gammaproteobacteria bacterium]
MRNLVNKRALILLLMWLATLMAGSVQAQQSQLLGVRMWPAPEMTRLVFDISNPVEHKLFSLPNPDRTVIDLQNVKKGFKIENIDYSKGLVKDIRAASKDGGKNVRIVLDMREKVKSHSYLLKPHGNYGHRLVVELQQSQKKRSVVRTAEQYTNKARDIVVAIDAGHGGEDPGALGRRNKIKEKDVVLAIAKKLKQMVDKEPGMRGVLTREGDYFLPLRKRTAIARRNKADLFISIHADSFKDHRAKGASVYTLSPKGATSEQARLLAQKENESDLIGGVTIDDKDDQLASVLLDLSLDASIVMSSEVASRVLSGLKQVGKLHKRKVEQAGFRVLKSPDMPSILIETAFISNPKEASRLNSPKHQRKMASAIMGGVKNYFRQNPPPGTKLAMVRKHKIERGDTLSTIASNYQIPMDLLKTANSLDSNLLRVGQVLEIP